MKLHSKERQVYLKKIIERIGPRDKKLLLFMYCLSHTNGDLNLLATDTLVSRLIGILETSVMKNFPNRCRKHQLWLNKIGGKL